MGCTKRAWREAVAPLRLDCRSGMQSTAMSAAPLLIAGLSQRRRAIASTTACAHDHLPRHQKHAGKQPRRGALRARARRAHRSARTLGTHGLTMGFLAPGSRRVMGYMLLLKNVVQRLWPAANSATRRSCGESSLNFLSKSSSAAASFCRPPGSTMALAVTNATAAPATILTPMSSSGLLMAAAAAAVSAAALPMRSGFTPAAPRSRKADSEWSGQCRNAFATRVGVNRALGVASFPPASWWQKRKAGEGFGEGLRTNVCLQSSYSQAHSRYKTPPVLLSLRRAPRTSTRPSTLPRPVGKRVYRTGGSSALGAPVVPVIWPSKGPHAAP